MKLFSWLRRRNTQEKGAEPVASQGRGQPNDPSPGTPPAPQAVSSDVPIRLPSQDAYGIDGFAQTLAKSIANADASEGLVFAIHGFFSTTAKRSFTILNGSYGPSSPRTDLLPWITTCVEILAGSRPADQVTLVNGDRFRQF